MVAGRVIGWLFIAVALVILGWDLLEAMRVGEFSPWAAGELWAYLDRGSLNLTQALIQRYLFPELWQPGIVTLLLIPAWILFVVIGVLLVLLCRSRRKRKKAWFY